MRCCGAPLTCGSGGAGLLGGRHEEHDNDCGDRCRCGIGGGDRDEDTGTDINRDGDTGITDFLTLLGGWGACP